MTESEWLVSEVSNVSLAYSAYQVAAYPSMFGCIPAHNLKHCANVAKIQALTLPTDSTYVSMRQVARRTNDLLLQYNEQMTTAARKKGNPPTKVMLMKVVSALRPYITLRPKLSGRLLSTPGTFSMRFGLYTRPNCSPSKSFPNLLSRRPRETVSWKRMFANSTASRSPICG